MKSVATYPCAAAAEEMTGDERGDERMVSEIVPIAVPIEVETDTVTLALPAVVGVPVIWRVEMLKVNPGGRPVALEENCVPVAESW